MLIIVEMAPIYKVPWDEKKRACQRIKKHNLYKVL